MKEKHKNEIRKHLPAHDLLLGDEQLPLIRVDGFPTALTIHYDKERAGYVFGVRKAGTLAVRFLVSAENIPMFLEWAKTQGHLNKT